MFAAVAFSTHCLEVLKAVIWCVASGWLDVVDGEVVADEFAMA